MNKNLHISTFLISFALGIVGGRVPTNGGLSTSPFPICKVDSFKKLDNMKKLTTEEFIARAREAHGDKYDYSKSVYVNGKTPITITCRIHGDFAMLPSVHTRFKCNCPKCSKCEPITKETFIKRSIERFGDRFDYSLVDFVNAREYEVSIKCNTCGTVFNIIPRRHMESLQGGCPNCRYTISGGHTKKSFEEFVRRAQVHFGDKYQYHKETFNGMCRKTLITCPIHGDFWQSAMSHSKGFGCKECANKRISEHFTLTLEQFLEKAREVHGNKYDYSLVEYKAWNEKVKIICPKHGVFEQDAGNHKSGEGCPKCKNSTGENKIDLFLRRHNIEYQRQYRINNSDLFCSNIYLFVDFYLPAYKCIIEFNGEQHYRPVKIWGGVNFFEKQQARDNALKLYCKDNKLKLIEIPYKDSDKIDLILQEKLKIHG